MPAKEYNEVKMRGILPSDGMDNIPVTESAPLTSIQVEPKPNAAPIPVGKVPDGAVQVMASGGADGSTVIVHTVTAGKILYLLFSVVYITADGSDWVYFSVRDGDDVPKYYFISLTTTATMLNFITMNWPVPIEIPAGYDIVVHSSLAGCVLTSFIFGYEMAA